MTGKEFKDKLAVLRIQQKQFALMNGYSTVGVSVFIKDNKVPRWASEKLLDWEKHPDLINDNMQRAGLIEADKS